MILCRATCCHKGQFSFTAWVCESIRNTIWINMNHLELSRIHMCLDDLVTMYTNLCDNIRSDVLPRGAVLHWHRVCVWVNTKYNINEHELYRIHQNLYKLRWINSDLYEFVWYDTERRVATGGSLAFTAWACVCVCEFIRNVTWINMNHLGSSRMNMS